MKKKMKMKKKFWRGQGGDCGGNNNLKAINFIENKIKKTLL